MKKTKSKHIRLDLAMLILVFGINAIIIFAITPVRTVYGLADTTPQWFNDLLTAVSTVLIALAMTSGFTIIAAAFFMNAEKKYKLFLVYIGGLVFNRVMLFVTSFLTYKLLNELPTRPDLFAELFMDQIFNTINVFIWDILFLLAAVLICKYFAKKQAEITSTIRKASVLLNDTDKVKKANAVFPFNKFYLPKNNLQYCLLAIALLFAGLNIIIRTVDIISNGLPESIPGLIGGYATDIVIFVIVYVFAGFLLTTLYKLDQKRKAKLGL